MRHLLLLMLMQLMVLASAQVQQGVGMGCYYTANGLTCPSPAPFNYPYTPAYPSFTSASVPQASSIYSQYVAEDVCPTPVDLSSTSTTIAKAMGYSMNYISPAGKVLSPPSPTSPTPSVASSVFEQEDLEGVSGNGWNDAAVLVKTSKGPFKHMHQPGHIIYAVEPGGVVDISILAINSGEKVWTASNTYLKLDAADGEAWEAALQDRPEISVSTSAAKSTNHQYSMILASQGIVPNSTGTFRIMLQAPSGAGNGRLGLYKLTYTPMGPCGAMSEPVTVHVEVTCSDQVFCNGIERYIHGRCVNSVGSCVDGDPCTVDYCEEGSGKCIYQLSNATECTALIPYTLCGGDRCERRCLEKDQCGGDGCGGVCGLCQTGSTEGAIAETCDLATKQCISATKLKGSCSNPIPIEVLDKNLGAAAYERPELSKHTLVIDDIRSGYDEVNPTCVNFGMAADHIYSFTVPHSPVADAAYIAEPGSTNFKRPGWVGIDVVAQGKYNPAIDTVLEIRGAPSATLAANGKGWNPCMDDRSVANNTMINGRPYVLRGAARPQRPAAVGAAGTTTPVLENPFLLCNDNANPPGDLGSHLSALLPPGQYYLIVSSYPLFNIPHHLQQLQDESVTRAAIPGHDTPDSGSNTVEVQIRFVDGYLPQCENKWCGSDGGHTNGTCAVCGAGMRCSEKSKKCIPHPCIPKCDGRQCGDDGCEGVCGICTLDSLPAELRSTVQEKDVYCLEKTGQCHAFPHTCTGARPVCAERCNSTSYCANDCQCRLLASPLPDLVVKDDALKSEISIATFSFTNDSCSLVEKCIKQAGVRKVLRFSVAITNQGLVDLPLDIPPNRPDNFVYSPCHHHYHYHHFADYSLIQDGVVKLRGHKQAFCLEDSAQELLGKDVPCLAHHTCAKPGIQRGWSDYYGADLDCQWIDVTDLPSGVYTLRVEVNTGRQLLESTFENNVAAITINIP